METALSRVAGCDIHTVIAGRTDTGAHALAQVLHFDTQAARPINAWVRGVNAQLPQSVAVLWAKQVPDDFHARYSALERGYHYLLLNHPVRPALFQEKLGWFHEPLRLELMQEAALLLLGEHDFSAFRAADCQAKSPVRQLRKLEISRCGDLIIFDFCANAFLHRMVRNIVGCLVYIGKGKFPPSWIEQVLQSHDRRLAAPTVSAAGLYLTKVSYDPKWKFPDFGRSLYERLVPGL